MGVEEERECNGEYEERRHIRHCQIPPAPTRRSLRKWLLVIAPESESLVRGEGKLHQMVNVLLILLRLKSLSTSANSGILSKRNQLRKTTDSRINNKRNINALFRLAHFIPQIIKCLFVESNFPWSLCSLDNCISATDLSQVSEPLFVNNEDITSGK